MVEFAWVKFEDPIASSNLAHRGVQTIRGGCERDADLQSEISREIRMNLQCISLSAIKICITNRLRNVDKFD